jgi:hypothetical protein
MTALQEKSLFETETCANVRIAMIPPMPQRGILLDELAFIVFLYCSSIGRKNLQSVFPCYTNETRNNTTMSQLAEKSSKASTITCK